MCNITAKNEEGLYNFSIVASFDSEISTRLENAMIFFNISGFHLIDLKIINPHNYNLEWFKVSIGPLLNQAVVFSNEYLKRHGITLPSIKEISYSDLELTTCSYFELMANPIIHIDEADFIDIN